MSHQSNVDAVQLMYGALAAGDGARLASVLRPDFIGRTAEGMPLGLGRIYDGVRSMQDDFWWELGRHYRVHSEPREFHTLDDGRLQVIGRYVGEGRRSGRKLDAAFVHIITFDQDGLIIALEQYTDTFLWAEALGDQA